MNVKSCEGFSVEICCGDVLGLILALSKVDTKSEGDGYTNPIPYFSIVSRRCVEPQLCLSKQVRLDESFEALEVRNVSHIDPSTYRRNHGDDESTKPQED